MITLQEFVRQNIDSTDMAELHESSPRGSAMEALEQIVELEPTSERERGGERLRRENPEFVEEAFAAARHGEGDIPEDD